MVLITATNKNIYYTLFTFEFYFPIDLVWTTQGQPKGQM